MTPEEVERRARAARLIRRLLFAAGAIISIGLVLFVISVLREEPVHACKVLLGPPEEVEQLAGLSLRVDEGIGGDRDCDLRVWRREGKDPPVVTITNRHRNNYDQLRRDLEAETFASKEALSAPAGGLLFIARRPKPNYHTIIFQHGDIVTVVELDARVFDTTKAKSYAAAVAGRAP
jgi:hypothetical protein